MSSHSDTVDHFQNSCSAPFGCTRAPSVDVFHQTPTVEFRLVISERVHFHTPFSIIIHSLRGADGP